MFLVVRRLLRIMLFFLTALPFNLYGSETTVLSGYFQTNDRSGLLAIFLLITGAVLAISVVVIFSILRGKRLGRIIRDQTVSIDLLKHENSDLHRRLEVERERMKKDLAESERLYGLMLSSADDGIAFYNTDWSLRFANSAFYSLIGYTEDEYSSISHDVRDRFLLHPDDVVYSDNRQKSIAESGFYENEIRIKHRFNGNYVVLSSKSVLLRNEDGKEIGILVISRDITSFREAQNELILAKEKAEESNRLKSSFLANISHEIRTPLNSIVGFSNLLNDSSNTPSVREEYIGYLNQNTDRLLQIISDIIDLSRLENSEIEISYNPVRINALLDFTAGYAKAMIDKSGKEIEFVLNKGLDEGRDVVYTDEIWLKRVFRHLSDNAVKFTRSGRIEVSSAVAGSSLMFSVKDTGIGINRDSINSIFEQFRQEEDGHQRSFEGLGIGLTLARHVIEEMDGYLWVESEKGSGSEFFFTIPYRPVDIHSLVAEQPEEEKSIVTGDPDWNDKKILVVDDNSDVLRYLGRILSDTGVTVIMAQSGEEAVRIAHEINDLDMILIDLQMSGMNGLEATQEIRKIRGDLPVIAQTAFVFEQEQDMIIRAGCDACIMKPIRKEQLFPLMGSLFRKKEYEE
ncbi:MAG: response regulator [Bacteroidales bacterium]|nr:response regulator [Bacteroidales bacterium]